MRKIFSYITLFLICVFIFLYVMNYNYSNKVVMSKGINHDNPILVSIEFDSKQSNEFISLSNNTFLNEKANDINARKNKRLNKNIFTDFFIKQIYVRITAFIII